MSRSFHRAGRSAAAPIVALATAGTLVLGLAAVVPAAPRGTPTQGTEQTWESGVVRRVVDGDTVTVDITSATNPAAIAPPLTAGHPVAQTFCADRADPDGSMPADGSLARCRVRMIGVQAPEKAGASGSNTKARHEQCGASAAKVTLTRQLPPGTLVQLRSISLWSVERQYSGGRLARTIYYRNAKGVWVDAAVEVLRLGQAMWFPFNARDSEKPEPTHNLEYRRLVDGAAAGRQGIFWPNTCGSSAPTSLRVWAVSDPAGDDSNREYVVLRNDGAAPRDVSRWVVRDSSLTYATLPAGTVIGPGDFIQIHSGRGTAGTPTVRDFYFNGAPQMFANPNPGSGAFDGDAVYVFDRQPKVATGNLRAWFHYPCDPGACSDPLAGEAALRAGPVRPPWHGHRGRRVRDHAQRKSVPLALGGYALARRGQQLPFPPTLVLPALGALRINVGAGPDIAGIMHVGRPRSMLANRGDRLTLMNLNGATVDCRSWGTYSCAGLPVSGPLRRPSIRPAAPTTPTVFGSGRNLVIRWAPPPADGSDPVIAYRVKVQRKVKTGWRNATSCSVKAPQSVCMTRPLAKGTYRAVVTARNGHGSGPASPPHRARLG